MTPAEGSPPITSADDPRLDGWYHTIELAPGLVTRGLFDHRSVVHATGLPDDLTGLTALDVGTANGYYAFEMERRGAERVVAVDVASSVDWDWLPQFRHPVTPDPMEDTRARFQLAASMLGSRVEHRTLGVYDLSPETLGTFDVVVCGSLLLHLQNPLRALAAIRSVTRGVAIAEICIDEELERRVPEIPALHFGARAAERELGEACTYWRFTTAALVEMMEYAGFGDCEPLTPYRLPNYGLLMRTVRGRPRALDGARGWHLTAAEHGTLFPVSQVPGMAVSGPDQLEEDEALAPLLEAARDDLTVPADISAGLFGGSAALHTELDAERERASEMARHLSHLQAEVDRHVRHAAEVTAYVRHLEGEVAAKNGHIASLEARLHALEEAPP